MHTFTSNFSDIIGKIEELASVTASSTEQNEPNSGGADAAWTAASSVLHGLQVVVENGMHEALIAIPSTATTVSMPASTSPPSMSMVAAKLESFPSAPQLGWRAITDANRHIIGLQCNPDTNDDAESNQELALDADSDSGSASGPDKPADNDNGGRLRASLMGSFHNLGGLVQALSRLQEQEHVARLKWLGQSSKPESEAGEGRSDVDFSLHRATFLTFALDTQSSDDALLQLVGDPEYVLCCARDKTK